ncbi:hypothetical protein RCL1_006425 [Eukaryota sp. TZLM3-RCL]
MEDSSDSVFGNGFHVDAVILSASNVDPATFIPVRATVLCTRTFIEVIIPTSSAAAKTLGTQRFAFHGAMVIEIDSKNPSIIHLKDRGLTLLTMEMEAEEADVMSNCVQSFIEKTQDVFDIVNLPQNRDERRWQAVGGSLRPKPKPPEDQIESIKTKGKDLFETKPELSPQFFDQNDLIFSEDED